MAKLHTLEFSDVKQLGALLTPKCPKGEILYHGAIKYEGAACMAKRSATCLVKLGSVYSKCTHKDCYNKGNHSYSAKSRMCLECAFNR